MRELNVNELVLVAGGGEEEQCTPENSGNEIAGIGEPEKLGDYLISVYEGLVQAMSYIFERIATSWG